MIAIRSVSIQAIATEGRTLKAATYCSASSYAAALAPPAAPIARDTWSRPRPVASARRNMASASPARLFAALELRYTLMKVHNVRDIC